MANVIYRGKSITFPDDMSEAEISQQMPLIADQIDAELESEAVPEEVAVPEEKGFFSKAADALSNVAANAKNEVGEMFLGQDKNMTPYTPEIPKRLSDEEKANVDNALIKDYGRAAEARGALGTVISDEMGQAERSTLENLLGKSKDPAVKAVLQEQLKRPERAYARKNLTAKEAASIGNFNADHLQDAPENPMRDLKVESEAYPGIASIINAASVNAEESPRLSAFTKRVADYASGMIKAPALIPNMVEDTINTVTAFNEAGTVNGGIEDVAAKYVATKQVLNKNLINPNDIPAAKAIDGAMAQLISDIDSKPIEDVDWTNISEVADWLTVKLAGAAPDIAMSIGALVNPAIMPMYLQTVGASSTGNKYAELIERGVPAKDAEINALVSGGLEIVTEKTGLDLLSGKLHKLIVSKPFIDTLKKKIAAYGAFGLFASSTEGGEEVINAFGGNLMDRFTGRNIKGVAPDLVASEMAGTPLTQGVLESFVIGSMAGVPTGGGAAIGLMVESAGYDDKQKFVTSVLDSGLHKNLDADQLGRLYGIAKEVNAVRPGGINLEAIESEIRRGRQQRADAALDSIQNAQSVDEAVGNALASIDTPIDAPISLETENVSDQIDATGLADATAAPELDNQQGSVPVDVRAGGSGLIHEGRADGAGTPESSNGSNLDVGISDGRPDTAVAEGQVQAKVDIGSGVIVTSSGTPYKTERGAAIALKGKGLEGTHEVTAIGGGFGIAPIRTIAKEDTNVQGADQGQAETAISSASDAVFGDRQRQVQADGQAAPAGQDQISAGISGDERTGSDASGVSPFADTGIQQSAEQPDSLDAEIRPIVESIAKRRAAAQQINKEKAFDTALGIAKRMLSGEQVKPGQLQMAARQLKNDAELFDQVSKLVEIAKAPAKAARAERAQSAEGYRSRISQAKTEAELQAIAGEIAKDAKLTDTQAADLDDAVMEAMDALDDSGLNDAEEKLAEQIADEVVAEVEADPSALEPKPGDSENAAYLKEQVNERIEQEDGKQAVADAERQAEADIADGSKESGEEVEASEVNVESDLSRVDAGKVLINAKDGYRIQKVGDKYHYSAAGNAEFKTEKLTRDELVDKLAGKKKPAEAEQAQSADVKTVEQAQSDDVNTALGDQKADPAIRQPSDEGNDRIHTLAVHDDLVKRVRAGEVSAGEFKAAFDGLLKNKDAILAELDDMSKQQLLDRGLPYWAKSEKKAGVVDAAYRDMMDDFTLGNSISYSMGEKYENVIRRIVDKINDEELKQYAESMKQASEERQAAMAEIKAGMENPQTLEDFTRVLRGKMNDGATFREAFMTLSPEQREQYDTMASTKTRSERMARKEHQKTDVRAAVHTTTGDIIETKHTKTGEPLFVVKAAERVEREVYNQWNQTAKRLGGWYSSFRGNGAVPGFQFKTRENAEAFLKYLGGDVNEAKEALQAKRDAYADDKSQTAVERLTEMADKLDERADESLGVKRKANTARRAQFAAAAEAAANADKAMAQTMRNIAAGIENGTALLLDQVRQKVQVELLQGMVTSAHYDLLRSKYKSYADYEQHKSEKPTKEVADYVEFPNYTAFRSDLAGLGRRLLENEGTKKLGQRIMSVADDVTDAYLKFAKENLHKVSRYGTADGKPAIFANKQQAEKAISRSGFKGKAIVLPFKRGENMIILSPSEAMKQGIWEGDSDKRITLNPDFGAELVEKLGKANRLRSRMDAIDVPWQFENAYDKRKRLSAMGIETPAELRAAIREFVGLRQTPKAPDRVKELERAMIGRRNDGLDFFPTPAGVADQMVESAELKEGMSVLEPSAGMGHIADRIRESGVEPDVVEISGDRRELLEAKGYNLVGDDFMSVDPRGFTFGDVFKAPDGKTGIMRGANRERVKLIDEGGEQIGFYNRDELEPVELRGADRGYDRIIMNPPFGDRRDAEHVRHAYELLRPGGRIVAIMGEGVFFGQDKKAQEFRAWLEEVGATDEKLEEGTFMDASLPVNTGVNARMVVIDKPEGVKGVLKPVDNEQSKAELKPKSKDSEKIEDVGEKMAGARKDMEIAARKEWSDEDLAAQPLSKIWPAGDIDAIEDTYVAAWAFASRAEIPSKPRKGYRLAAWVAKVKSLRLINAMALDGFLSKDKIQSKLNNFPALKDFDAKVRLLERLPREQWKRIGKVREYPNAYTYDASGVKIGKPQVTVEIDGRSNSYSGGTIDEAIDGIMERVGIAAPEKRMQFEVRGSGGKFHIYKKGDSKYHKLSEPFADPKDAFAFIKESYDELVAAWDGVKDRENVKKTDMRSKSNKPRTGQDWRKGRDVGAEEFASQFGFRGVEFGLWVKQGKNDKERQGMVNQAYDALMDLASILNIPPRAISLNGSIGLAFGSRGKGWAAAHYEPGNLVINLTKTKGAGNLAHEWFHALDNYFSRMRDGEVSVKRGLNAQKAYRESNYITYRPEPLYVHKTKPMKPMTKADVERYFKLSNNSSLYAIENWEQDKNHPVGVRPEVEAAFADLVKVLNESPMRERASAIDGAKENGDGYWSRIIERAARSFENYAIHKMLLNGYQNDYLANVVDIKDFARDEGRYPYLLENEIAPVAEAFDNLFSTIKTKETDKGVAMFSRSRTSKAYPELSDVLEQYEGTGEIATFTDLVDEVEALIDADEAPESLQYAVDEYRDELAFDYSLAGRGDMGAAEEKFIGQVRAAIGGSPGFSRQFTGAGMAVADVEHAVNRIRAGWKNAPEIIVVDNMNDSRIRKAVRDENERQLSQGAEGQPEGFYDAGKVYIVASELNGEADIVRVLFHETLGHAGLRGLYGKELEKILDQVAMMRKKDIEEKGDSYGLAVTYPKAVDAVKKEAEEDGISLSDAEIDLKARELMKSDRRIAAEEVLAEMAQTNPQIGFVKRAIAAIRNWLRKHVPYFKNLELTDADIIQGYLLPARRFVEIGKQDGGVGELVSAFMRRNRRPSKEQGDSFITAALEYLSRDPDFFQAQASEAKDIYAIGKDIDAGFRIEKLGPSMTREKGADRAWEVFVPNSKHRAGIIMTKDDKVWVDLQYLRAGTDRGSRIYAVAADYAHNNGKVLIGDPAGLSRLAYYRRNENMLSSALKHGTTRHLMPHMAQMNPEGYWTDSADRKFAEQARPLTWVVGDDVNNIKELVYNSYDAAIKNVPEIKDVIYDPESGDFKYTDGRPFTREDSERIAAELSASSRPYRAGSATLKRAALFNTFLRREGREGRRQLLDRLVDQLQGRGLKNSALRRVMYSRAQQDQTQTTQFKAWFGDSVVTDNGKPMSEGGKPLVVYHGTLADFASFDPDRQGQNVFSDDVGFFFTDSPAEASAYADPARFDDEGSPQPNVMPVYLAIKNPKVVDVGELEPALWYDVGGQKEVKDAQQVGHDGLIVRTKDVWQGESRPHNLYVAFNPEQIKSAIGNNGQFDPANPDIRFSRRPANVRQALEKAGINESGFGERLRNMVSRVFDPRNYSFKDIGDSLRQGYLDRFYGALRAERQTLGNLPPEQSPYVAMRLATGISSVMRGVLTHGMPRWSENRQHLEKAPYTKGLLDILEPVSEDINDWLGWMVGNRAARLMQEGRENNFTKEDIAALRSLGKGKEATFLRVAKQFADFKRGILDIAEQAGLIDAETRPVWDHADWIPFYREVDGMVMGARNRKGLSHQNSGIRKLRGGESGLNDPLENIIMNFQHLLDASLKNNALMKAVDTLGEDAGITKVGLDMKAAVVPKTEVRKQLIASGVSETLIDALPENVFDGMAKMMSIVAPVDKSVIRIMRDGKAEYYRVDDPLLLRAVTAFSTFDMPGLSTARAFKRLLTTTVTSVPEFWARNFVRDTASAKIIAKDGTKITGAIRGVYKSMQEEGGFEQMLFAGASFAGGYIDGSDPEAAARAIRRSLRAKGYSASSANEFISTIVDTPAKLFEMYQNVGNAVENANREAVFEVIAEKEGRMTKAAYESKDLMDFSLRGDSALVQLMADTIPFFNARLQGLYRLGRTDPKRAAMRAGLMLVLPSILLAAWNDDDERYKELADWDKDSYWHFWLNDEHYRIPKPFEIGVLFATIPERITHVLLGSQSAGSLGKRVAWNAMEQLNLVEMPQIVAPAAEVFFNYDTFRQSGIENMSDANRLPVDRYDERTSYTMRMLAQSMPDTANAVGASPKNLEHLFLGYTGTVGSYALALADTIARGIDDAAPTPEWRPDQYPVLKAFWRGSEPAFSTQHVQDIYEMARESNQILGSIRFAAQNGNDEEVDRLYEKYGSVLDVSKYLSNTVEYFSDNRKQMIEIQRDKTMTPKQKREAINELLAERNEIAREVAKEVKPAFGRY